MANAGAGAKDFSPLHQPSRTIGSVVRGFKIGVTKWFRKNTDVSAVWQRNYYEHIIRNNESMNKIQEYIAGNPAQWDWDRENLMPGRQVAAVVGNEPWRV